MRPRGGIYWTTLLGGRKHCVLTASRFIWSVKKQDEMVVDCAVQSRRSPGRLMSDEAGSPTVTTLVTGIFVEMKANRTRTRRIKVRSLTRGRTRRMQFMGRNRAACGGGVELPRMPEALTTLWRHHFLILVRGPSSASPHAPSSVSSLHHSHHFKKSEGECHHGVQCMAYCW
jgi:hypothetical protein